MEVAYHNRYPVETVPYRYVDFLGEPAAALKERRIAGAALDLAAANLSAHFNGEPLRNRVN